MGTIDIVLLVIRWLHVASAAVLVGGCMFYVLALRFKAATGPVRYEAELSPRAGSGKATLAVPFLAVIVASGVVLGLDRLSRPEVTGVYLAVLGLKLLLAGATISLVRRLTRPVARGRGRSASMVASNLLLALGSATFLASVFLRAIFEVALRQG